MQLFEDVFLKKKIFSLFVENVLKKVLGKFFGLLKVLYFCRMKGFVVHLAIVGHSKSTLRGVEFGCVYRRKLRSKSSVCRKRKNSV